MANPFVWHDLMTSDPAAAEAFYRSVVGWTAMPSDTGGPPYTILLAGAAHVGGIMAPPPDARSMPPQWNGYIGVDDVDGYVRKLTDAGGKVWRAPQDIPQVGRFAVVADPFGAGFILFKGAGTPPPALPQATRGHVGWNELYTEDLDAAWAFYSGLFGWQKGAAVDMGPMGVYQLFNAGGEDIGGMMKRAPDMPPPSWQYYFNVDSAGAALARIKAAGGAVLNGPHPVPGGMWIVNARDPQGATFSVVAPSP